MGDESQLGCTITLSFVELDVRETKPLEKGKRRTAAGATKLPGSGVGGPPPACQENREYNEDI